MLGKDPKILQSQDQRHYYHFTEKAKQCATRKLSHLKRKIKTKTTTKNPRN